MSNIAGPERFGTEAAILQKAGRHREMYAYEATMIAFLALCLRGSWFSIWRWQFSNEQRAKSIRAERPDTTVSYVPNASLARQEECWPTSFSGLCG